MQKADESMLALGTGVNKIGGVDTDTDDNAPTPLPPASPAI